MDMKASRHFRVARIVSLALALATAAVIAWQSHPAKSTGDIATPNAQARLLEGYGQLPLRFEANRGQADKRVRFLARQQNCTLFLTPQETLLAFRDGRQGEDGKQGILRTKLIGANQRACVRGVIELPGTMNYFLGNDPKRWRTGVPTFERVKYEAIYPGVDLVFYSSQGELKYDFIVAPNADPQRIRMSFARARGVRLDEAGDLVIATEAGDVRQHRQEFIGLSANQTANFKYGLTSPWIPPDATPTPTPAPVPPSTNDRFLLNPRFDEGGANAALQQQQSARRDRAAALHCA